MASKPYNGHPSWNAWNVSLWLGNDEFLYRTAMEYIDKAKIKGKSTAWAARMFIRNTGLTHTPDVAKYSVRSVSHALSRLSD